MSVFDVYMTFEKRSCRPTSLQNKHGCPEGTCQQAWACRMIGAEKLMLYSRRTDVFLYNRRSTGEKFLINPNAK